MKKLFLILATTCTTLSFAQPVITAASFNPVAGDFIHYRADYIEDTLLFPGIETAGPGLTWDYSTLYSPYTWDFEVHNAADFSYYDSFPTANIAIYSHEEGWYGSVTTYWYALTNDSFCKTVGDYELTNNVYSYSDGFHFKFPMNYGDTFTDTSVSASSSTIYSIETNPAEVDAYGTLILPSGTFYNALRLKIVEYNYVTYYWMVPGIHFPVLNAHIQTPVGSSTIPASSEFYYTTAWPTNISNVQNTLPFSVFPNPAADELNVSLKTSNTATTALTLTDATGRIVYTLNAIPPTENKFSINTANLPTGIYILKVISGDAQATQKFTVIH